MLAYGRFRLVSDNPETIIHGFHGFLGASSDFELLNRVFSRTSLIGHDLVGHGTHIENSLAGFYTDAQVRFWRNNLPNKSILLGYSMGGRLALQLACQYPDFLKGLILVGASPGLEDPDEQKNRQRWDRKMAGELSAGMKYFLGLWNELSIISSQRNIERAHHEKMQKTRLFQDPYQLQRSLMLFGTGTMPSCWHLLGKLRLPVLLIAGEHDLKYCNIAKKMDVILAHSKMRIISDAGHCCHLEQPRQTAQIIETWLENM